MSNNNCRVRTLQSCYACVLTWLLLASSGYTQTVADDPVWKEAEVPAPPAFSSGKLLPLNMPHYVTLTFGIDPATLAISADGIVRYVVVARSTSGAITAMYEGISCVKGEVKTYARANNTGAWSAVSNPQWRDLNDNQPSKHALVFARQGACDGQASAASSIANIILAMKQ